MKLNEKIAYYRRERKLSQEELAARVGVSRQAVSKWELGEASPDIGKLLALAKAFGVTTDHLLNEGEGPARDAPPPPAAPAPVPPPADPRPELGTNLPGFLGRMVRRWGWLAGVYLALQGAGLTLFGLIGRFMVNGFFQGVDNMETGFGAPGGGWAYSGPPEFEAAIMEELGIARPSPLSGFQSVMLAIPTLALVIGLIMVIGGLILAYALWKNGKKGE